MPLRKFHMFTNIRGLASISKCPWSNKFSCLNNNFMIHPLSAINPNFPHGIHMKDVGKNRCELTREPRMITSVTSNWLLTSSQHVTKHSTLTSTLTLCWSHSPLSNMRHSKGIQSHFGTGVCRDRRLRFKVGKSWYVTALMQYFVFRTVLFLQFSGASLLL